MKGGGRSGGQERGTRIKRKNERRGEAAEEKEKRRYHVWRR